MENNEITEVPVIFDNPELEDQANDIIKKYAMLAAGAGLIPIFGVDVAAVAAVQVKMAQQMAKLYGVPYKKHTARLVISSGLASVFTRVTSYGIREFFHSFDTFGDAADELTNAAVSGFFTAASGEIYKLHFQQGLGLETLDFSHYFSYFKEQIEQGNISPNMFKNINSGFGYLMK